MNKLVIITGEPGSGKTTVVKKIVEKLKTNDINLFQGFITEELRDENHQRIGFDVIDIKNDSRAALARTTNIKNAPKVGKYSVDIKSFESIALKTITQIQNGNIYIYDEIGKMESFSNSFEKSIISMLEEIKKSESFIIASVPVKSIYLADKFKTHQLAQLFTINNQNRNLVVNEIYELLKEFLKIK